MVPKVSCDDHSIDKWFGIIFVLIKSGLFARNSSSHRFWRWVYVAIFFLILVIVLVSLSIALRVPSGERINSDEKRIPLFIIWYIRLVEVSYQSLHLPVTHPADTLKRDLLKKESRIEESTSQTVSETNSTPSKSEWIASLMANHFQYINCPWQSNRLFEIKKMVYSVN